MAARSAVSIDIAHRDIRQYAIIVFLGSGL